MSQFNEFEDKGWKRQMGQVVTVTFPPAEETYYVAQEVRISTAVDKEIGIVAQSAVLNGTFEEKVYFRGQSIVIEPQAHLKKGLDVQCQVIDQQGKVDGGISGNYGALNAASSATATESLMEETTEQALPAN